MLKMNCKPLALLPNTVGFRFVGIRHDGTLAECYVQQDPRTRCHFVAGDATYRDLKGWVPNGYQVGKSNLASVVMKWVKDVTSLECHTATRFDDPACKGCSRVLTLDK